MVGREAVNLSQQVSTNHLVGLGLIYTPLVNGAALHNVAFLPEFVYCQSGPENWENKII